MNRTQSFLSTITTALSAVLLSGCYVEVTPSSYVTIGYENSINDFKTETLITAALAPFELTANSVDMLVNPLAYPMTLPEFNPSPYAVIYANQTCPDGGYARTQADALTTDYDDGFTYIDMQLSSQAFYCKSLTERDSYEINGEFDYDLYGWFDRWSGRLSSITATFSSNFQLTKNTDWFAYTQVNATLTELTSDDFSLTSAASLHLDDGISLASANLITEQIVHWYAYDKHPHQGQIILENGFHWVRFSFTNHGVWREDSDGYRIYWRWSSLGY